MDAEMYKGMSALGEATPVIERGIALHKMIRSITMVGLQRCSLQAGAGWLVACSFDVPMLLRQRICLRLVFAATPARVAAPTPTPTTHHPPTRALLLHGRPWAARATSTSW